MVVDVKSLDSKNIEKPTVRSNEKAKITSSYLQDFKSEFNKITWTSKPELQTYTMIVVAATFICGMGVYFVDLAIRTCLSSLEMVTRFIFG